MAQHPLPSGHSPIPIPENVTLARLIEIINQNFAAIPRIFKGDNENIFVTQSPNTVNIAFGEDTLDGAPGVGGGGGGGGPGPPPTGEYEITYVNSTGCIQDPTDPNCAIPFDVQFRDRISFVGGVLTRTLLNAFVNMHNECKFQRCGPSSSSVSSSGANYLDRWRLCDTRSSGSSSDDADIFLHEVYFEVASLAGFVEPVLQLESGGPCYFWVEVVQGEVETAPPGEVQVFDGCDAPECHSDPCDAACQEDQVSEPSLNDAAIPGGCLGSFDLHFAGNYEFDSFSAAGGPGGTPVWYWRGIAPEVNSLLEIYCDAGRMYARLTSALIATTCWGDGGPGVQNYADITDDVSCGADGNLSGSFTLLNNNDFCDGGDRGMLPIGVTL